MPVPSDATRLKLFSPCPRGTEAALSEELRQLGADILETPPGGVRYAGDRALAYRANLHARIPSRVLMQVAEGDYRNEKTLYALALDTPWESWFDATSSLRVDVSAIRSPLRSLNFATLKVKDAIVDRLRERTGQRPSIDTRAPDVRVFAFLTERRATLYLDLSGEPLFKRGWRGRDDKGEAPLKENLAAALLALAGWSPGQALYDPFCGSGTILIEAAQMQAGIAPGLSRSFALQRLRDHDSGLFDRLRADAMRAARMPHPDAAPIAGSDIDPRMIELARRNAERAGLARHAITFEVRDFRSAPAPFTPPGKVVTNPPYGERIGLRHDGSSADEAVIGMIGANLKRHFGGWQVWMLSNDRQWPRQLGLREKRKYPLYNGAIECRLFGFEVFDAGARA